MDDRTAGTTSTTGPARVLDDRYELDAKIGAGGMAEVWRAHDRRLDRDVALKLLPASDAADSSRRKRIEREARALAALNNPNIVAVYDYGEERSDSADLAPYLVMELVDGPDLHRFLQDEGPLGVASALQILRTITSAVATAHAVGIVHGDLKPANVFIDANGPKVGDFGVARLVDEETGATTLAATPAFAAPEVLRGAKPTPASDIYSLACLAFEMLTGHAPFEGSNAWEVASKHLEAPIPSVRMTRPEVPVGLDEAIRRGMQKDPSRRPRSAKAFAESLGDATSTVPVAAATEATKPREPTEVLPSRPDLEGVAVFGPLAGWPDRVRERVRKRRHGNRNLRLAIAAGLIVPLALVLVGARGHKVRVPDVRGQTEAAAATKLQGAGLVVSGVSYEVVTQGSAGTVLRTIPSAGQTVARGSQVHVIVSAFAAPTPEPSSDPVAAPRVPRQPRGKHKGD